MSITGCAVTVVTGLDIGWAATGTVIFLESGCAVAGTVTGLLTGCDIPELDPGICCVDKHPATGLCSVCEVPETFTGTDNGWTATELDVSLDTEWKTDETGMALGLEAGVA